MIQWGRKLTYQVAKGCRACFFPSFFFFFGGCVHPLESPRALLLTSNVSRLQFGAWRKGLYTVEAAACFKIILHWCCECVTGVDLTMLHHINLCFVYISVTLGERSQSGPSLPSQWRDTFATLICVSEFLFLFFVANENKRCFISSEICSASVR